MFETLWRPRCNANSRNQTKDVTDQSIRTHQHAHVDGIAFPAVDHRGRIIDLASPGPQSQSRCLSYGRPWQGQNNTKPNGTTMFVCAPFPMLLQRFCTRLALKRVQQLELSRKHYIFACFRISSPIIGRPPKGRIAPLLRRANAKRPEEGLPTTNTCRFTPRHYPFLPASWRLDHPDRGPGAQQRLAVFRRHPF